MRLLIYFLAMLTGFSVAEAARPVAVTPASVDAAVGEAYAVAVVKITDQAQVQHEYDAPVKIAAVPEIPVPVEFSAITQTTPVELHDVILG